MSIDAERLAQQIAAELEARAEARAGCPAQLKLDDGRRVDCRVLHITPSGALIDAPGVDALPQSFNLAVAAADFEAACEVRCARHIEQSGVSSLRAGVMFMSNRLTALQRFG